MIAADAAIDAGDAVTGYGPGHRVLAHRRSDRAQRPGAAEGLIQGPPYHCDIHGMRALFPAPRWAWPKPPYPRLSHPAGMAELAVELVRA